MSFAPGYFTGTVEAKTLAGHPPVSRHWLCTPSRLRLGRTLIPSVRDCMPRTALPWFTLKGKCPSAWLGASPSGSMPAGDTGMALHPNSP